MDDLEFQVRITEDIFGIVRQFWLLIKIGRGKDEEKSRLPTRIC